MTDFKKGDAIKWKWGNGEGHGTVESTSTSKVEIESNGSTITRNGSKDDQVVTIKDDKGNKVLKLASELSKDS